MSGSFLYRLIFSGRLLYRCLFFGSFFNNLLLCLWFFFFLLLFFWGCFLLFRFFLFRNLHVRCRYVVLATALDFGHAAGAALLLDFVDHVLDVLARGFGSAAVRAWDSGLHITHIWLFN